MVISLPPSLSLSLSPIIKTPASAGEDTISHSVRGDICINLAVIILFVLLLLRALDFLANVRRQSANDLAIESVLFAKRVGDFVRIAIFGNNNLTDASFGKIDVNDNAAVAVSGRRPRPSGTVRN